MKILKILYQNYIYKLFKKKICPMYHIVDRKVALLTADNRSTDSRGR